MKKSGNFLKDFRNDTNLAERTIEEVSHETPLEWLNVSIVSEKYFNLCSFKSSPKLCSKSVQTDPNVSDIPSSSGIMSQELAEELYTCFENTINTLSQASNEKELNSKSMKILNYKISCYKYKLHPVGQIPDVGEGRELEIENLKKEFYSLLEKAVNKNAIADIQQGKDSQPIGVDKEVNPTGYDYMSKRAGCSSDLSFFDETDQVSVPSRQTDAPPTSLQDDSSPLESCCDQVSVPSRQTDAPPTSLQDECSENIAGSASNGFAIINGKLANFVEKSPPGTEGLSNTLAGCTNGASKRKNVSVQAENASNFKRSNENGHSTKKNFIKINIMRASKTGQEARRNGK